MNKKQAAIVANQMLRKGASAYAGGSKYTIASYTGVPVKKLTDLGVDKVAKALYEQVIAEGKRPAIEVMHAEEKLKQLVV